MNKLPFANETREVSGPSALYWSTTDSKGTASRPGARMGISMGISMGITMVLV